MSVMFMVSDKDKFIDDKETPLKAIIMMDQMINDSSTTSYRLELGLGQVYPQKKYNNHRTPEGCRCC